MIGLARVPCIAALVTKPGEKYGLDLMNNTG